MCHLLFDGIDYASLLINYYNVTLANEIYLQLLDMYFDRSTLRIIFVTDSMIRVGALGKFCWHCQVFSLSPGKWSNKFHSRRHMASHTSTVYYRYLTFTITLFEILYTMWIRLIVLTTSSSKMFHFALFFTGNVTWWGSRRRISTSTWIFGKCIFYNYTNFEHSSGYCMFTSGSAIAVHIFL